MKTQRITTEIAQAADAIRAGQLVAVPTETVYGLAGNGLDPKAVAQIYEVKGRPSVKPLSLMVHDASAMARYCAPVPQAAYTLAEAFWPGPLTIVLRAKDCVPEIVRAGGQTVGLRCPDHPATLALIEAAQLPLAAPSANPSGAPSPKTADDVLAYFDGQIAAVIDGGPCGIGRESTLVDLSCTPYRILRAVKNRYGSTNEIGVFDMGEAGLRQIENPSQAMLSGRPTNASGTCVTAVMEGTRPLLAEIQGLATTSGFGTPRRMSTGVDYARMALILAVLEKRAGFYFSNLDAYLNVVGGLRIDEPAVDLAVAMALVSSLKDTPIRDDTVVFGEIGLAGELRSVSHIESRVSEAYRLGFTRCVLPYHSMKSIDSKRFSGVELIGVHNVREAFDACVQ